MVDLWQITPCPSLLISAYACDKNIFIDATDVQQPSLQVIPFRLRWNLISLFGFRVDMSALDSRDGRTTTTALSRAKKLVEASAVDAGGFPNDRDRADGRDPILPCRSPIMPSQSRSARPVSGLLENRPVLLESPLTDHHPHSCRSSTML